MSRFSLASIALGAICCLLAQPAMAEQEFCVDTVSEFSNAFAVADEENVIIRVEQGTYDLTNTCMDSANPCNTDDDITIIGGYTNNCAARNPNATLTVLTRPNGNLRFFNSGNAFEGTGDVRIQGLTFRNVNNVLVGAGGNLTLPDVQVRLSDVWFDRSAVEIRITADVILQNTMVTGATAGCAVKVSGNDLDLLSLTHVTVANNSGTGVCVATDAPSARYEFEMVNSILWGNATDLEVNGANPISIAFLNNTYATTNLLTTLVGQNINRITTNPQFVNPALNDYELGGTSSSINSAFPLGSAFTDKDLKGDDRRFSILADRGALESAVGSTATVLTVTTTADSGLGSLRQAISDANQSPNLNRIHFDIGTTCGPRVISLLTPLPDIIGALEIDGYTQPGAARNTLVNGNNSTLCIVLQQPNGSFANSALVVPGNAADTVSLRVDGLGFSDFTLGAILFGGGNGHAVVGSQFGGDIGAINLLPSGYGVQTGAALRGLVIGGPEPADRNTFTEALLAGISISAASPGEFADARIENNYIGLTRGGILPQGNAVGIRIRGAGNRVLNNVISGNTGVGIELDDATAFDNKIEYNRIGRASSACVFGCLTGNGDHGVLIRDGATRNQIRYNDIWYNQGAGIAVVGSPSNPIYQNVSIENDGQAIDLGTIGRTANDSDSAAPPSNAGNRNQNFPVLSVASGGNRRGRVSGSLGSVNGWFRIDFYSSSEACPSPLSTLTAEGRDWIGSTNVQITDATGAVDGSANFVNASIERLGNPTFFTTARAIIATATRYDGNPQAGGKRQHTSEVSNCRTYVNDEIFSDGFQ